MEEKKYKITLADGTALENLGLNGDNYISAAPVEKSVFDGNCHSVTISDGETETTYENMDCVQVTQMGGEYWFVLRQLSAEELEAAKMRSDIEYIALMCDVEL